MHLPHQLRELCLLLLYSPDTKQRDFLKPQIMETSLSLGYLFQSFTILIVRRFFLMYNLKSSLRQFKSVSYWSPCERLWMYPWLLCNSLLYIWKLLWHLSFTFSVLKKKKYSSFILFFLVLIFLNSLLRTLVLFFILFWTLLNLSISFLTLGGSRRAEEFLLLFNTMFLSHIPDGAWHHWQDAVYLVKIYY